MNILILFAIFFALMLLSVPIGISLGTATAITMLLTSNIDTVMIAQKAFTGLDSFTLIAIPFFMLAGNLMSLGGIARRIVNFADVLVGKFTGGLGYVTVGVIIPPSIPFVIYGVASGTSVGDLFKAGVIPGVLIGLGLMFVCGIISHKRGYKGHVRAEKVSLWKTFLDSFWALLAPVIILGGIYSGIFTPTEAAVIATVYSLFAGVVIYRELTLKIIIDSLKETANMNGYTGLALGFSMSFAAYLAMEQIPQKIASTLLNSVTQDWLLMALMLLVLLIVGCFIDNISSCLILTPVMLPIAIGIGMSPVHFGIAMTVALAIGFVTPPYGVNLFVASGVSKLKIEVISKAALPFLLAMFICLLLIAYIPGISMFLVNLIGH